MGSHLTIQQLTHCFHLRLLGWVALQPLFMNEKGSVPDFMTFPIFTTEARRHREDGWRQSNFTARKAFLTQRAREGKSRGRSVGAFPVLKFRHSTNSASLRLCVKEGPLGSVNSIVLFSRAEPETMGSVPHFMTFPILHHRGTETQRVMWDQRGHPLALFSRAERTANDELHASDIGHQRTDGGGRRTE